MIVDALIEVASLIPIGCYGFRSTLNLLLAGNAAASQERFLTPGRLV